MYVILRQDKSEKRQRRLPTTPQYRISFFRIALRKHQ